jgi:hypothetical protein
MEPTYQDMTIEHLGGIATDADLQEFRAACAVYQARTGCSDLEATDYMWGSGDWLRRVWASKDMTIAIETAEPSGDEFIVERDAYGAVTRAAGPLHYSDQPSADDMRDWLDNQGDDAYEDGRWYRAIERSQCPECERDLGPDARSCPTCEGGP